MFPVRREPDIRPVKTVKEIAVAMCIVVYQSVQIVIEQFRYIASAVVELKSGSDNGSISMDCRIKHIIH